jgi:ligand-binding sensor domain-containing protein
LAILQWELLLVESTAKSHLFIPEPKQQKVKYPLLPFIFLLFACETKNERQPGFEFKRPKVVEAKEYQISPDKISPPVVIRATHSTKKIAIEPKLITQSSNVFPAKAIATISAGSPKIVLPEGKQSEPPQVVAAAGTSHPAGSPEMIELEAPYFSENNRGIFNSIKAKHGLNSDEISSVYQDKNGNIWIGEWWGGMSRYDGRFIWNYTTKQGLASDVVNCFLEDSKGNLWIATVDSGVNKFDGKYFTHYSTREGLQGNYVNCLLEDKKGNMWFGTNSGLTKFDGRMFTQFTMAQGLPTNDVWSLMEDSKGQLWVGAHGGLTKFDGHSFQNYTTALKFDKSVVVTSIMEEREGIIWYGTSNGLYRYDGEYFKHYTSEGGLSSNVVTTVMKQSNGNIWIGTRTGGVNRYDGKSFTHFGIEHGLPNERVTSIMQDKWQNIWLSTTGGVCRYQGKMFSHIIPIKQQEIEAVLADSKGNIWMGSYTDNCLNKYDGTNLSRYTTENGFTSTEFNYIYEDKKGNFWFGTWSGVDMYDGKYFTHYSKANGLIDDVVFYILEDKKGIMWFATRNGLSSFDGKYFTNYLRENGLCSETLFSLLEDHSGNLWIGTSDNGICKFDGKTFTHFPKTHSLSHPLVLGMIEDQNNNIWISTSFGVNKFDGKYFTWYTAEQGLSNNITKNLLEDMNGNIWVGTINGLNKFVGKKTSSDTPGNDATSYFKNYTATDGFSGAGTYENTMVMDPQGSIWIGSNDRLTRYHPEGDIKDTIAPVMKLTGISLFGEKMKWQDISDHNENNLISPNGRQLGKIEFSGLSSLYNQPENLRLAYNNNFLTFHFIGITTNRPKEVKYRYLLDGFDDAWTSTVQPVAVYNKLPHGKFTFRAQSANSEGYWSDELKYSFEIFPPWWETTIAYIIYAIVLFGVVWMVSWYRSRRLKAQNILLEQKVTTRTNELKESLEERYKLSEQVKSQQALLNERLRISRDLHDEIGSTLGSISIYSEVAKKRSEKNENPVTVLSKIGVASRELIEKMSDIVWSLNLNTENFEQMQHRMNVFATMILAPRNIHYDLVVDENAKQIQLSSAQAKNIFLIYKEALYNIVKYADSSSVQIKFRTDGNDLVMTIEDNGKGFFVREPAPADQHLGGNGIKNMYVRADEIQGRINLDSQIGRGTTIELRMPV